MWGTQLRGAIAFGVVCLTIGIIWVRLSDDAEVTRTQSEVAAAAATTTSTTTTSTTTTTTSPQQALDLVCARVDAYMIDVYVSGDENKIPELALALWTDLKPMVDSSVAGEISAVIEYYQSYLEVAQPFDFDPTTIIRDGDSERFERLMTLPASGLDASAGFVGLGCGIELPPKPSMTQAEFDKIDAKVNPKKR